MFYRVDAFVALCCVGLLAGCSEGVEPEKVPPLNPVSGKITLDGQPAAGVAVTLTQAGGAAGTGGYGISDGSGAYTIQHRSGAPGVPTGEYVVLFSKMAQPDGSPIPEGQTAADVLAENVLPERYSSITNPQYRVIVAEGGTTKDFELSSR